MQFKTNPQAKEKDVRKKATGCKQAIEKADTADKAYKSTLQKTNQAQTFYYEQKMPQILMVKKKCQKKKIISLLFIKYC